jgi:hypothetical protein
MAKRTLKRFTLHLPVKRPFQWRVFFALVALYFLGNLAGIPLLRKTDVPLEPVWYWGVVTIISALVIAFSLALANRTGLGVPFLEGQLSKADLPIWLRSGIALCLLMIAVGFPLSLIANLDADPATYPFGWELLLASFKAGVVEEIFGRFFLVSLFVWLGSFIKHDAESRPTPGVYWMAILLAALIFGWGHVDARLSNPAATFWDYALIMVLSSSLGIYFGWLFWTLGLEWAMIAHFIYDAFISMVVIPAYLLKSPIVWFVLLTGLTIAVVMSWEW